MPFICSICVFLSINRIRYISVWAWTTHVLTSPSHIIFVDGLPAVKLNSALLCSAAETEVYFGGCRDEFFSDWKTVKKIGLCVGKWAARVLLRCEWYVCKMMTMSMHSRQVLIAKWHSMLNHVTHTCPDSHWIPWTRLGFSHYSVINRTCANFVAMTAWIYSKNRSGEFSVDFSNRLHTLRAVRILCGRTNNELEQKYPHTWRLVHLCGESLTHCIMSKAMSEQICCQRYRSCCLQCSSIHYSPFDPHV